MNLRDNIFYQRRCNQIWYGEIPGLVEARWDSYIKAKNPINTNNEHTYCNGLDDKGLIVYPSNNVVTNSMHCTLQNNFPLHKMPILTGNRLERSIRNDNDRENNQITFDTNCHYLTDAKVFQNGYDDPRTNQVLYGLLKNKFSGNSNGWTTFNNLSRFNGYMKESGYPDMRNFCGVFEEHNRNIEYITSGTFKEIYYLCGTYFDLPTVECLIRRLVTFVFYTFDDAVHAFFYLYLLFQCDNFLKG